MYPLRGRLSETRKHTTLNRVYRYVGLVAQFDLFGKLEEILNEDLSIISILST